ncbi:uncharacterized protein TM35_000361870 [Trypanosoma theileri]|uniref:Oxidation resistance protein 1 n=1 Tax=Trypanosoma theileri TaxID=67003 RepID=A0A1X0NL08_9TRYP|nr:uncharacterized protein TM35_000361870 [Trypanosoma theileri]ORC85327.1 hypothetical protein TM35_000361870 [Trypanosoma theileri]
MSAQCPPLTCRITPPGRAVRVNKQLTTTCTMCSCSLNTEALFPDGPPSPPLPLSRCELHELLLALPNRLQESPWHLCYDTEHDGFSLQNFYRVMQKVNADGYSGIGVFVVTSGVLDSQPLSSTTTTTTTSPGENATVIGCFTPQVPCLEHSQHGFFGTEETFVFSYANGLLPNNNNISNNNSNNNISTSLSGLGRRGSQLSTTNMSMGVIGKNNNNNNNNNIRSSNGYGSPFYSPPQTPAGRVSTLLPRILSFYGWVMEEDNREFIFCANDFFGIGGGRDGAAILVDSNLLHGSSSIHCGTFASPPLCGKVHPTLRHSEFTILRMVWFKVKERKRSFTCMDLPKREPCECGRVMESMFGGFRKCLQNNAEKKGWHLCSDDLGVLFTSR